MNDFDDELKDFEVLTEDSPHLRKYLARMHIKSFIQMMEEEGHMTFDDVLQSELNRLLRDCKVTYDRLEILYQKEMKKLWDAYENGTAEQREEVNNQISDFNQAYSWFADRLNDAIGSLRIEQEDDEDEF